MEKRELNYTYIIGLFVGLIFVFVPMLFFSGARTPLIYLNIGGFLFTIGGTIASAILSYPKKDLILSAFKGFITPFIYSSPDYVGVIQKIYGIASRVRGNILLLYVIKEDEEFLKEAISLIKEGYPPDEVENFLKRRVESTYDEYEKIIGMYFHMTRMAPTFGFMGTVVGLIAIFSRMGEFSLETIAPGMGVALSTTLYGIILAGFIFSPLAEFFRKVMEEDLLLRKIIAEGCLLIARGKHPLIIREAMVSLLPIELREKLQVVPFAEIREERREER